MATNNPTALPFTPIVALAEALRKGNLTATTLADRFLQRIGAHDQKFKSFVDVYPADCRQAAAAADAMREAGYPLGPLHGIPIALKDLLEIEGRRTTVGSQLWRDRVSTQTATVVSKLLAAGMIPLGKTNLVEFALGAWGINEKMGTPWNPWDPKIHRVPGGSSSGSAVAVAAGFAPAAIGSDTGGSIRIPASQCGLVGLKATVGRISNHGVVPLSSTLDTLGPITRCVEDAALLFSVLHGPDLADRRTMGIDPVDVLTPLKAGIDGVRLAILPEQALSAAAGETRAAFNEALHTFEKLGARIDTIELPLTWAEFAARTGDLIVAEGYAQHRDYIERTDLPFDRHVQARLCGGKMNAADYIALLAERRSLIAGVDRRLADYSALVLPTTPFGARQLSSVDPSTAELSHLTRPVNYLDLCALALPCGFDKNAMPLSLQIVGRSYHESDILRIGWTYEQATEWHQVLPLDPASV
jgi:aspartyl-tRNA(Asn)/glutamyl-tRNA(Gln) amidotransferase subunit A